MTNKHLAVAAALAVSFFGAGTSAADTAPTPTTAAVSPNPPQYDADDPPYGGQTTVSGTARVRYLYAGAGDDIRFTFKGVRGNPFTTKAGGHAAGTVLISHTGLGPDGKRVGATGTAKVDCVAPGGDTASLTAVITKDMPLGKKGTRLGFSVTAGGPGVGRLGFSWGIVDGAKLRKCLAPAPFAAVIEGGFTIGGGGELPPPPVAAPAKK
ncbi:hypothetical protein [Nonomuraea endophytica]|uniref:hypothetical protein n=1 Tax=Nonomuraea endophytica TaxID=714136 RepID=UPI0037CB2945